jgi:hypothetical protein
MDHDHHLSPLALRELVEGMCQAVGEVVENLATMIMTKGMGQDGVCRGAGARRHRKEETVT